MTESCWINGKPARSVDVADRGLQYGDGLFETLPIIRGRPMLLDAHLARLQRGARALKFPEPDLPLLEREMTEAARSRERAVMKLILTRGPSGRGYRIPEPANPSRILTLSDWPPYPVETLSEGVKVRLCSQRLSIQPALAGLKHLNRLEQVLARSEWDDPGVAEGLMLDTADRLVCGTMSNIFIRFGTQLVTPVLSRCGVRGIMRDQVRMAATALGLPCTESDLSPELLRQADEMFVTNALIGLWPVRQVDDHVLPEMQSWALIREWLAGQGVRQCAAF